MENQTRKRKTVTLEDKLELIQCVASVKFIGETAAQIFVSKGTVQVALNKKNTLFKGAESNWFPRKGHIVEQRDVDVILCCWFSTAHDQGLPIIGPIMREKAVEFSRPVGVAEESSVASGDWLGKWK